MREVERMKNISKIKFNSEVKLIVCTIVLIILCFMLPDSRGKLLSEVYPDMQVLAKTKTKELLIDKYYLNLRDLTTNQNVKVPCDRYLYFAIKEGDIVEVNRKKFKNKSEYKFYYTVGIDSFRDISFLDSLSCKSKVSSEEYVTVVGKGIYQRGKAPNSYYVYFKPEGSSHIYVDTLSESAYITVNLGSIILTTKYDYTLKDDSKYTEYKIVTKKKE